RLRQTVVEALVRLNVGVVAEEVELVAVVELDTAVHDDLDGLLRGRTPLLDRARVMRQLGSKGRIVFCEGQRRRTRDVADGLVVLGPPRAVVDKALPAQRQADVAGDAAAPAVLGIPAAGEVFPEPRTELDAFRVVLEVEVEHAGDRIRAVL